MRELRFAIRRLLQAPLFTAVAVITLALGIGANSAIFSVINAVLIRALPYPDEGRLVLMYGTAQDGGQNSLAPSDFLEVQRASKLVTAVAAWREWPFNVRTGDLPERVNGAVISADFFTVLDVAPQLGRLPEAAGAGRLSTNEVVISDSYWRTNLGARPGIIGSTLNIGGEPVAVVGVMPPGFDVPLGTQIWRPSPFAIPPHPLFPTDDPSARTDTHYFETLARVRPGVPVQTALAEASMVMRRIGGRQGADTRYKAAEFVTLHEDRVGESRSALLVLFGAAAVLLLIACTNLANLLLARTASRSREQLVRAALGASKWQLVRESLAESLALSALGGAAGLGVAVWGVASLRAFAPGNLTTLIDASPDVRVLAFTGAAALLTGLAFGVGPALHGAKGDLASGMRDGGRGAGGSRARNRVRNALAVTEIALACVLAIGAGLLVKAFIQVQRVPEGFDPRGVFTAAIALPAAKYPDPARRAAFVSQALERIAALPQVTAAGIVSRLPLNPGASSSNLVVFGREERPDDPNPDYLTASPGYFNSMSIPVIAGRDFDVRDVIGAPSVAIINAATAARFWPGQSALGKRIQIRDTLWREVVGVTQDVRQHLLERSPNVALYIPYAQDPWSSATLVAHTTGDPAALTHSVERVIHALDADQPLSSARTMDQVVLRSLGARRFTLALIGLFTAIALVLAAVGVYGVIAYGVAQRTREVGVRIALGALPRDVVRLVVGDGLRLALFGVGVGLFAAVLLAPALQSLLYAVTPRDPATFSVVAATVAAVALLASWLPAHRASQVDPIVALREE